MRRSVQLLWSAILMSVYLAVLLALAPSALPASAPAPYQTNALATRLIGPHIALVALGLSVNWFAYLKHVRGLALLALAAYAASLLFMPNRFPCVLLQSLLCFAAFSAMGAEPEDTPPERLTLKQRCARMWSTAVRLHRTGADDEGEIRYDPAPDLLLMITAICAMAALLVLAATALLRFLA